MANDHSPSVPPPDENPFAAPEVSGYRPSTGGWRRVLVVILGIVCVPIAAAVCGFCCCAAGIITMGFYDPAASLSLMVLAPGGFIGGGVVAYLLFRRLWRWVTRTSEADTA